ncbi:MAG: EVE domain-containing protein [Gammaproteobacteria bacterium]
MKYWLMKSEPGEFSIDDLARIPDRTTHWDGVRNYQARNMIRDDMKIGDQVFFYHSNCQEPGIVGIMEVCREAYPDSSAFDPEDKHFDPKSKADCPSWFMVDVRMVRKLARAIGLNELKQFAQLENLALVRRGNRLSVMPVTREQWDFILSLD